MEYRVARIPKGKGKIRELYIVPAEDKERLRLLLPVLENILVKSDPCGANYSFQKGKNCALNALQHVGYRYTLSLDLEDFFNSISKKHVAGVIPDPIIDQCFIEGSPKQGLPTSPIISVIAFLPCDKQIVASLKKLDIRAVYSRYADDLIFSFDDKKDAARIGLVVEQIVERHGFKINQSKTWLQDSANGRVMVTGIAVDSRGLHATRRTRRKIRAATHQGNKVSLHSLLEWSRCKLPAKFLASC